MIAGPGGPTWLGAALAAAVTFLLGVVLVVAVDGGRPSAPRGRVRTITLTRTVPATITNGGTVIVRTAVPPLVGEPLDTARARVQRAGFRLQVDQGGGLFGPLVASHWQVTSQTPAAGTQLEEGSTVHVDIQRT